MQHEHARHVVHASEWLLYVIGFLFGVLGTLFLFMQNALPTLFPNLPALSKLQGSFGPVAGIMLLVWAAACFWVGHGLHHHHNQARIALIVLSLLIYSGAVIGAYSTRTQVWIIGLIGIVQIYLFVFQKEVVALFTTTAAPKPSSSGQKK